jgi:GH24 family phage-related lysozyme (muramidase)
MWPSVSKAFVDFNTPLEGCLTFMYTDARGLVTTGMGNLVDPVSLALALPWKNPDGSLTDAGTIQAQWQAVKNGPVNSSVNAGPLTTIRLDKDGVTQAVAAQLALNEAAAAAAFPAWAQWPADAQMAVHSMMWAMGSGFTSGFPQFMAAVNATPPNFAACAAASAQNPGGQSLAHFKGVGIQARITANDVCWLNAQQVVSRGLDPSQLYYPSNVTTFSAARLAELAVLGLGMGLGAALYFKPMLIMPYVRIVKGWLLS